MEVGSGTAALIVELAAQSAIVQGKRVELPPIEFSLLAALASRPGVLIPHKELSDVAFGAGVPMTLQDLHWRISRMRKLVGERSRKAKWIENRRGQGYLLDLPEFDVQVVDRAPASTLPAPSQEPAIDASEGAAPAISLKPETPVVEQPPTPSLTPPVSEVDPIVNSPLVTRKALRPRVVIAATLIGCTALTSAWAAGYLLSSSRNDMPVRPGAVSIESPRAPDIAERADDREKPDPRKKRGKGKSNDRRVKQRPDQEEDAAQIVVANSPETSGSAAASDSPAANDEKSKPHQDSDKGSDGKQTAAAPALPPAPTRLLYHLVDQKSGDHFITTDGAAASEYEAMGYEGGAIAQVYGEQEESTRAITTNNGAAYVFTSATPKTEPSSRTVALWYATDGQGDFFYTTSRSEAEGDGWSASVVGYVRSL